MKKPLPALGLLLLLGILALAAFLFGRPLSRWARTLSLRSPRLREWFHNSAAHPDWRIQAGQRCASGAPFIFPTTGYVGFLWDDSFRLGQAHQGIDIFGGQTPGETPIIAAASGYLTRRPDWKSTVAIRLPDDPLHPGRPLWTYYTHIAWADGSSLIDPAFPPGVENLWVEAGTLLGYQGNYSGSPNNPTGVHLHFSLVLDDGAGFLRNELDIRNTLDPSPYLGLSLNGANDAVPTCPSGD